MIALLRRILFFLTNDEELRFVQTFLKMALGQ